MVATWFWCALRTQIDTTTDNTQLCARRAHCVRKWLILAHFRMKIIRFAAHKVRAIQMCVRVHVHKNSMELPYGNAALVLRTLPDAREIDNELFYLTDKTDQKKKNLHRSTRGITFAEKVAYKFHLIYRSR